MYRLSYKILLASILTLFVSCFLSLSMVRAQEDAVSLDAQLYLEWDVNNAVSAYPWQDVVPVSARLSRDSYVYLFVINQRGVVTMNYPTVYLEANPENVIWGGQGQDFLRFIRTGVDNGVMSFFLIASLEPLTQSDLAQFTSAEGIRNARLSTSWYVLRDGQVNIDQSATISETVKQDSPLWEYYQYILANGGL